MKTGAAVLTLFAPFLSLVAALALQSNETNPVRRASLRTWAVTSAVWLGIGLVIAVIGMAAILHSASADQPSDRGPCQGGPQMGADGVPLGHGRYRFPCEFGGSTVVRFGR
jgi:hypothetical protein